METTTKNCPRCKTYKSTAEFGILKSSKDGLYPYCKECASEKAKKYRNENPEKIKESKAKEYLKNKEKYNERNKQDYQNNKDKYNKLNKDYYYKNNDNILEQKKLYYEKNKDIIKAKHKSWVSNNKEHLAEYLKKYNKSEKGKLRSLNSSHKRRAKFKEGDVANQQLKDLYQKTTHCYWCNHKLVKNDTHLDHYVPLAKGGLHTISNLVLSCSSCNLTKGSKDPIVFALEKGKLF